MWYPIEKFVRWISRANARVVDAYNKKVFDDVRNRWQPHVIELKELVWERESTEDKFGFLVFIDVSGQLDWICDDDKSKQKLSSGQSAAIADIMDVASNPCISLCNAVRLAFMKMLGTAVVSVFNNDLSGAKNLKDEATRYLERRINERSRLWTLTYAVVVAPISLCAIWFFCPDWGLIEPISFGLLGAFASIVRRMGYRPSDSNAGRRLHFLEVLARFIIGSIFGVVAVKLMTTSLAPEALRSLCSTSAGTAVVAFAAGLFDAFVPSMISKYVITKRGSDE